ncbi:MAG: SMC-Scp complex subunit ScpB [Planctomycetota bacterium]
MTKHEDHEPTADATPEVDQPCGDLPITMRIEALLIGTDKPLTEAKLAELLAIPAKGAKAAIKDAITALNQAYAETGRAFRIDHLAGGWQILTQPECGVLLTRLHQVRQSSKLSQAALETLSIVAYRQPIMRAEIEAIRGVASGEVLRGLMERRLVKIVGRAEELGRPMLYGTTKEFLHVFGIANLDDLPTVEGLERRKPVRTRPETTPDDSSDDAATDNTADDTSATENPPASEDAAVAEVETKPVTTTEAEPETIPAG